MGDVVMKKVVTGEQGDMKYLVFDLLRFYLVSPQSKSYSSKETTDGTLEVTNNGYGGTD